MTYKKPDFHRENKDYELTAFLITYNQKDFIREAMDSIIMQKVNFNYQLLVSDDCSTDGTSEILEEYAQKYDFVKIKRAVKNSYPTSILNVLNSIDTKYIALLDGDDYWIDDQKLQDQYDILESNEDCVVAYDSIYKYDTDHPIILKDQISDYACWGQTAGTVYRNIIDFSLYPTYFLVDGSIYLIFSQYGKLAYRSKVTSFYRYNSNGIQTSLGKKKIASTDVNRLILNLGFCLKENIQNNYIEECLYCSLTLMYKYMKHINENKIDPKITNDETLSVYLDEFKNNIYEIFQNKINAYQPKNRA